MSFELLRPVQRIQRRHYQALGSIAVASAIYLILEFSQPYSGLFRISPISMDDLIAVLGR